MLTRKPGERIFIGDDIVVTVGAIDGGKVKIGFDAPKSITILREEVRDRNKRYDDDDDENFGNR